MNRDDNQSHYQHGTSAKYGILITNLGTPDAPTATAVRRYLAEFLSDPRVVELPRALWWLILHGFILRTRPRRSAHAYQQIWTAQGSPLRVISEQQTNALRERLANYFPQPLAIALGMRYGKPAIATALQQLKAANVQKLLVLPLYPQYSATTTAATFDAVSNELQRWRWLPELQFITGYADHPAYIQALTHSIKKHWEQLGKQTHLLFSFHGMPQKLLLAGDPYYCFCHKTARLIAEQLGLSETAWTLVFQSRFGRAAWLQPYCDETLKRLPSQGVKELSIICPGFAADCLETLEEIAIQNQAIFKAAGGEDYHYIPALNAEVEHIDALAQIIIEHTRHWL